MELCLNLLLLQDHHHPWLADFLFFSSSWLCPTLFGILFHFAHSLPSFVPELYDTFIVSWIWKNIHIWNRGCAICFKNDRDLLRVLHVNQFPRKQCGFDDNLEPLSLMTLTFQTRHGTRVMVLACVDLLLMVRNLFSNARSLLWRRFLALI